MRRTIKQFLSENKHLLWISLPTFLIIEVSSFVRGYGYFIDEFFYYIACASHPALGYVDHPPFAPLVLTIVQAVLGTSLFSLRLLPALSQSASVFLTGILAREMGGGRIAQCLAAGAMAASPTVLAFGGFYSMNAFEPLLAISLLYCAIRMLKENNPKYWIGAGIVMGLGMMNKHTFGLFIAALVFSLLIGGKWRLLRSRWFVAGGLCAFLIFLPNVLWQAGHDFPSLEFYRNISLYKNVSTPPGAFLLGQIIGMSPATVPLWCAGAIFLLLSRTTKEFRFLSILFISLFLFMMLSGTSRSDRLLFAYPPVFAGGALFWENVIMKYNARWLSAVFTVLLVAGLATTLPIVLPYFNYEQVSSYTKFIGYNTELEKGKKPPLPQLLADKIGWEEKVVLVLRAYGKLTDEEKRETIISAGNYGQAGAIELYGKPYGLPPVLCEHNNYYLWSKERCQGSIVLRLTQADNETRLKERFESVEPCDGEFSSPYVSSHENNLRVFLCRGPKITIAEMLERGKTYF